MFLYSQLVFLLPVFSNGQRNSKNTNYRVILCKLKNDGYNNGESPSQTEIFPRLTVGAWGRLCITIKGS